MLHVSKYKPANLTVYGGKGFSSILPESNEEHNRLGESLPSAL